MEPRWHRWALAALIVLNLATHLRPLWEWALWGADTGEYLYLVQFLQAEHFLPQGEGDYTGFGISYPEFPGLFIMAAAVAELTGLSLRASMLLVVPAFNSLAVLVVYLIARQFLEDHRAGLVALLFLLITPGHLYSAAHAMPGSVADVFLTTAIWLVLLAMTKDRLGGPGAVLVVLGFATAASHHMTSYFMVVVMAALFFAYRIRRRDDPHRRWYTVKEAPEVLVAVTGLLMLIVILVMWFGLSIQFRTAVIELSSGLRWPVVMLAVIVAATAGFLIPYAAASAVLRKWKGRATTTGPREELGAVTRYAGFTFGFLIVGFLMAIFGIPGTTITVPLDQLGPIIPAFITLGMAAVGPLVWRKDHSGNFILLWCVAVLVSMGTAQTLEWYWLLSYRQTVYLFKPVALLVGAGFVGLVRDPRPLISVGSVVVILGASLGVLTWPPSELMGGFEEGTTAEEESGLSYWMINNETPGFVVTPHKMSSLVFGLGGQAASFDHGGDVLLAQNTTDLGQHVGEVSFPQYGRRAVTHLVHSPSVYGGVDLVQWVNAGSLGPEERALLNQGPYGMAYDNGEVEIRTLAWTAPIDRAIVLQ